MTPKELAIMQKENLQLKQDVEILNKGYDHIREKITEHRFLWNTRINIPFRKCEVLEIANSSHYQSFQKEV
ncbi:hypothetical protein [Peribacillus frigoritolerans]|uniref:hypothetical protein n=1 Tax=Peribacillus frigoritolerans TaxID=450367 RepID=UPI0024C11FBC|nr:hypothetical protein [Peribacillus frigoritolerans]WHX59720.1 hypothetical protein QNH33_13630 [Peribacillus frigoritolerans]